MTVIYFENDADPAVLDNRAIGVIGYGTLGKPTALNLRYAGFDILVAGLGDEERMAHGDGFTVGTIANVTRQSDILLLMLPDEVMPSVYIQEISPNLKRGNTLIFSSAYNIAFGFVEPPPFVDVGLIAPRTFNGAAHTRFAQDDEYASFIAVWQDASRQTLDTVLAIAFAMGTLRTGAVEINITQEAEISLFIEQALIPAFHHIMLTASKLLMRRGYPPEALFTDLYLNGKFNNYLHKIAQNGVVETLKSASLTSQYGALSRLNRFSELKLERLMEITLDEIHEGNFSREWSKEFADGKLRLDRLMRTYESEDAWEMEQQTLEMFAEANDENL